MKIIGRTVAGLLAGMSVYSEAQLSVVETSVSYMSEGLVEMDAVAFGAVTGSMTGGEADGWMPKVVPGDISQLKGVRGRAITFYSSYYGATTFDRMLSGCDGGRASGWVSMNTLSITCPQTGVEFSYSVKLAPPDKHEFMQNVRSGQIESEMIISGSQGTRIVFDNQVLSAAMQALSYLQQQWGGNSQSRTAYTMKEVRHIRDWQGGTTLAVDLSPVDSDTGGGLNLTDILAKIYTTPREDGEKTTEGNKQPPPPLPPPSGGDDSSQQQPSGGPPPPPGGNDGRNPRDNQGVVELPETAMIFSIQVNLQQLIHALIDLIVHANPEQLKVIEQQLEQLRRVMNFAATRGEDQVDSGEDEEARRQRAVLVSRNIAEALTGYQMVQNMGLDHLAQVVGNSISDMLNYHGVQQPAETFQRRLKERRQQLQDASPAQVPPQPAVVEGAVGGGVEETDGPTGPTAVNAWRLIMLTLMAIQIQPSEPPVQ